MELLIDPHYQAIVSVAEHATYAWEVLFRFQGDDSSPQKLIRRWEQTGYIKTADCAMVRRVKMLVDSLNYRPRIAVNVSARTIQEAGERYFGEILALASRVHRLIIEITETYAIDDVDAIAMFSRRCLAHQIYVGLDDCIPGDHFSEPEFLRDVRPAFLKLDAQLIEQAARAGNTDPIETIVRVANACRARTIIEGIDTPAKLDLATELGVTFWQGYLGGRPALLGADTAPALAA